VVAVVVNGHQEVKQQVDLVEVQHNNVEQVQLEIHLPLVHLKEMQVEI
jgi:hypothetical protein